MSIVNQYNIVLEQLNVNFKIYLFILKTKTSH